MDVRFRILCAVLALSSSALGAESSPLDLVMPDARILVGLRLDRILASPLGAQIKTQMAKSNPDVLTQIKAATGFDLTRDLREVIIATTAQPEKNPPTLLIVRGSFNPARYSGLAAFGAKLTRIDGLPALTGGPKGAMAVFLDASTMVAGDSVQVRAAIARHKRGAAAPAAVADRVQDYSARFDAWIVSVGSLPAWKPATAPALRVKGFNTDALRGIEQFHGGIRVGPDFELAAEVLARTEKDAAELSGAIGMIHAMLQAKQLEGTSPELSGLEKLKFETKGKRVMLSMAVSAEEMQKSLTARLQPAQPASKPSPAATATSSAPAAPRPHTIRIQTSATDIRTVVVPPR